MADGRGMILIASGFMRTARLPRIRAFLPLVHRGHGGGPGLIKWRTVIYAEAWLGGHWVFQFLVAGESSGAAGRWCHRWSVPGPGLMGHIGPGRPGHMLRTLIHFNLSNRTLTAEAWAEGRFSLAELCRQMFDEFVLAAVFTCRFKCIEQTMRSKERSIV